MYTCVSDGRGEESEGDEKSGEVREVENIPCAYVSNGQSGGEESEVEGREAEISVREYP